LTLVVSDEVDLVDVPVPRKVTLEVATSRRVAERHKHVATKSRLHKHGNQSQMISYNYFEKNTTQDNRILSKTTKDIKPFASHNLTFWTIFFVCLSSAKEFTWQMRNHEFEAKEVKIKREFFVRIGLKRLTGLAG
jgi:hypothetical protein